METLTAKLMADSKAMDFLQQFAADVDLYDLSIKYTQLAPHSDATSESMCLAIEYHLRNAAIIHFMDRRTAHALKVMESAQVQARKRKAAALRRDNAAIRRVNKLNDNRGNK